MHAGHTTQLLRAKVLFEQGRPDIAEHELRKVLSHYTTTTPDAHALMSLCLLRQNRLEEAMEQAKRGVQVAPDNAYAYYILSLNYLESRQFSKARMIMKTCLSIDHEQALYWHNIAAIYAAQKQYKRALHAAKKGLTIDSDNIACLRIIGYCLGELKRYDLALGAFYATLKLNPEDAQTYAYMGDVFLAQKDIKKATLFFKKALRLSPTMKGVAAKYEALRGREISTYNVQLSNDL